jgi:hypothetical protein
MENIGEVNNQTANQKLIGDVTFFCDASIDQKLSSAIL